MMKKNKIILVEDEAIIRMQLETALLAINFEIVGSTDNGREAMELVGELKPDIVLMDIRIKGDLDGIETAEIIKEQFEIPIVFLTGYLDEEKLERSKLVMPFGYLLKPVQDRDLKVALEMALHVHIIDQERKSAEEQLLESEQRYKTIVEVMGDGLYQLDREGYIKFVNKTYADMMGYRIEEVIGKHWSEVIDLKENKNAHDQAMEILSGTIIKGEVIAVQKSGNRIVVAYKAAPFYKNEEIVGIIGTTREITLE